MKHEEKKQYLANYTLSLQLLATCSNNIQCTDMHASVLLSFLRVYNHEFCTTYTTDFFSNVIMILQ